MKIINSIISNPVYPYTFLQPQDKIAFLDIETTGLSPNASSLYLIGLMRFDVCQNQWLLRQWFADNYHSEKKMLQSLPEALSDVEFLYHFNGQTFDIPYLLKKCVRHAITLPAHCNRLLQDKSGTHSIDLLKKIRPLRYALSLEKCRQADCERFLGLNRTDSFSGADLIPVYSEYMQQKILAPENAQKLEQALLLHNYNDIKMMLNLCCLLAYGEYLSDTESNRLFTDEIFHTLKAEQTEARQVTITLTLPAAVPKEITIYACYPSPGIKEAEENRSDFLLPKASLTFREKTAVFHIPLYHGTLKFFFPDYKNYFYLPAEDTAIHKSVAEFVDHAYRKKATAATCYTKKEGTFLPDLCTPKKAIQEATGNTCPVFYRQHKDSLAFYELTKGLLSNRRFWAEYLKKQLPFFRKQKNKKL